MDATPFSLGARWLLPVSGDPVRDPLVAVSRGKIVTIRPRARKQADTDLGDVVLLPKLINAHTHLEFSQLQQPIGTSGHCITNWIPQVVRARQTTSVDELNQAILKGVDQSVSFGTIAIGDIATTPWFNQLRTTGCHVTCFVERLGNQAANAKRLVDEAQSWLATVRDSSFGFGLSPHAPYSVHPELFSRLIELAQTAHLPIAMHLAESQAEIAWLRDGKGPFLNLLETLGALGPRPSGKSPLDFLRELSRAEHVLIVHGNYLNVQERQFLAERRERMFVVYCPRTHVFFGHETYPLSDMLDRGIQVAIGTDSRASNPDLSVWREMKTIRHRHPDVHPSVILRMGTHHGALALQVDGRLGQLAIGSAAEFLALPSPSAGIDQLFQDLFDSDDEPQPVLASGLIDKSQW